MGGLAGWVWPAPALQRFVGLEIAQQISVGGPQATTHGCWVENVWKMGGGWATKKG